MRLHGSGVTFSFGVPPTLEQRVTVSGDDTTSFATGTFPGVPDASDDAAPKISTRLLDLHSANPDSVKGHAA